LRISLGKNSVIAVAGTKYFAIVFTVGFEHSDPQTASQVAKDLVTRNPEQDCARSDQPGNRYDKFLQREVQRVQAESAAIDGKIARGWRSE
jgi:hypothetical protein